VALRTAVAVVAVVAIAVVAELVELVELIEVVAHTCAHAVMAVVPYVDLPAVHCPPLASLVAEGLAVMNQFAFVWMEVE